MATDVRLDLIERLSESLSDKVTLTPEQDAELDRRLNRLDQEGSTGSSWEEVRARIQGHGR